MTVVIYPTVYASNFGAVSVIPVDIVDLGRGKDFYVRVSRIEAKIEKDKSITLEIRTSNAASDEVVRNQIRTAVETQKTAGLSFTYNEELKTNPHNPMNLSFNGIGLKDVCQIIASTFVDQKIGKRFVEAGELSAMRKVKVDSSLEQPIGGFLPYDDKAKWEESYGILTRRISDSKENGRC